MIRTRFFCLALIVAPLVSLPARAADPKYLPGDTELIVTINFKQIMDSALVQKQKDALDQAKALLENAIQGQDEAQRYLKNAGFDIFRDLISVTIGMPPGKDPENGFIIIEGDFNPAKFNSAAEDAARDHPGILKVTSEGNQKIYEVSAPNGKQVFISLAQKKNLLIASGRDNLLQAIARGEGTSSKGGLKGNVKRLTQATNAKQSFSFVATGNLLSKALEENRKIPNAEAVAPLLQAIDGLSGAVTVGKDIQFQLGIGTSDTEKAQQLAQGANLGLFTVRTIIANKAKEDEKFAPLVDVAKTMRITTQGSNIVFRADVSAEVLEKLIKNFKQN